MRTFNTIILVCSIAAVGTVNFAIGRCYERRQQNDHSICAKAIEADSLIAELDECKAVYIELNNGEKLKIIKP